MEHLHKKLSGSNPSAEFKCMDREIYSPLDASSSVTIDMYALRRYNSAFVEVTELKLNVQLNELNRSEKFCRDFQKSRAEPRTCQRFCYQGGAGSGGFKFTSRQSMRTKWKRF